MMPAYRDKKEKAAGAGLRPAGRAEEGGRQGIDGRIYFHDEADERGGSKQVVISVKAGHVTVSRVRDLRGVLDSDGALTPSSSVPTR